MGELKPFVKEGWRKDLIAASGAARNSVFNKHLKKKKKHFPESEQSYSFNCRAKQMSRLGHTDYAEVSTRTCRHICPSWIGNFKYKVLLLCDTKVILDWWQSTNSQNNQFLRAKLL